MVIEGSFDYATIMSGFDGAIVQDSINNAILVSNEEGDSVGRGIIVPADSTKDKKRKLDTKNKQDIISNNQ